MLCKVWYSLRHKHKHNGSEDAHNPTISMRRRYSYHILSSIPSRSRQTRWRTYTNAYVFRSAFSLDLTISTRRRKLFFLLLLFFMLGLWASSLPFCLYMCLCLSENPGLTITQWKNGWHSFEGKPPVTWSKSSLLYLLFTQMRSDILGRFTVFVLAHLANAAGRDCLIRITRVLGGLLVIWPKVSLFFRLMFLMKYFIVSGSPERWGGTSTRYRYKQLKVAMLVY